MYMLVRWPSSSCNRSMLILQLANCHYHIWKKNFYFPPQFWQLQLQLSFGYLNFLPAVVSVVSLYLSHVTRPCFHWAYISLICLISKRIILFSWDNPLPHLHDSQHLGIACFYVLRKWCLKSDRQQWTSTCKNIFPGDYTYFPDMLNSQHHLKSPFLMSRRWSFPSFPLVSRGCTLSHFVVTVVKMAVNHCFAHEIHSICKEQIKELRGKQKTEQRNSRKELSQHNPTVPEWTS